jgi:heme oxygenase
MNDSTTTPTMQRLRDATRDEHDNAENHPFQQALVKGEIEHERYASWLGQMYLIHSALESALRDATDHQEVLSRVVRDYQYQVPYLLEDLQYLGIDPEGIAPLPATSRFLDQVDAAADDPLRLLGLHYVLEGSNNGSRHIARRVAAAYQLAPGPGLRYLDPYGDRQREYWQSFKNDMGAIGFSESDNERLVAAAKQMYRTVAELSSELAGGD